MPRLCRGCRLLTLMRSAAWRQAPGVVMCSDLTCCAVLLLLTLHTCMYMCVSLSLSVSLPLSLTIYMYVHMYICMYVYIYIYIHSVCVCIHIYTYIRIVYQMISLISHAINHFNTHSTFGRDGTGNTP